MSSENTEKVPVPKTYRNGPSDPHTFDDGPGTWVEIEIAAPPSAVWAACTDLNLPARYSDEYKGGAWVDGGPHLGAEFKGSNENEQIGAWDLISYVDKCVENEVFGWATSDPENPGARWWFTLTPTDAGTRLRYDVSIGPGPSGLSMVIGSAPDMEARILSGRLRQLHTNMVATVGGVKDAAERA